MKVQSIKKIVIGIIVVIIVVIGMKELYFDKQIQNAKASSSTVKRSENQIDDVVKTIVEMNYQPITSIVKENTDKAYVVIDLDENNLKDHIHTILNTAKQTDIKLTFIDKDSIFQKDNSYLDVVEKDGHTILPDYINLKEIFEQNNVDVVESATGLDELNKKDAAIIVTHENVKTEFVGSMEEHINKLEKKGYHFKAFV